MTPDPALDLFPLAAAVLAAITCGLLGNLLLLQKRSLMGDAISHGVLPGLVIGFLISGSRDPLPMLAGAAGAGVVTVLLVAAVRRIGRVESGAAMGVVFTVLFAVGVLLIEQAAARQIDLDAECVLHGQLETLVWYGAPITWTDVASWSMLESVPRQVWMLLIACTLAIGFIGVLFKELRLTAFDPATARALGVPGSLLDLGTMILVAIATVASFEAVGSILVVAMLVCPAATARFLTDRLSTQMIWSVAIAITTTVLGYGAATAIPTMFGWASVNAAGSMTVVAGAALGVAIAVAPRHGLVARAISRHRLTRSIALEDLLLMLWRAEEEGAATVPVARHASTDRLVPAMVRIARRRGLIEGGIEGQGDTGTPWRLNDRGRAKAMELIRRHRLWEQYLVDEAGLAADHVHTVAERLEHVEVAPAIDSDSDPHGRPIPPLDRVDSD
jgi:manganese/zinc/iron transport system permease protein